MAENKESGATEAIALTPIDKFYKIELQSPYVDI